MNDLKVGCSIGVHVVRHEGSRSLDAFQNWVAAGLDSESSRKLRSN